MIRALSFAILAVCTVLSAGALAQSSDDVPPVCTGYDRVRHRWGPIVIGLGVPEDYCPRGFAVMSVGWVSGKLWWAVERFPLRLHCCALPAGALLDIHEFARNNCPDGFVVTGGKRVLENGASVSHFLRCTKLNPERYELGSPSPAWQVGWGDEPVSEILKRIIGRQVFHTTWNRIPAALRYGLFRLTETTFDHEGCVGRPWGSLFVGRSGADCETLQFRPLLMRADNENPVRPARVYPPCRALTRELSPDAACLPDTSEQPQATDISGQHRSSDG